MHLNKLYTKSLVAKIALTMPTTCRMIENSQRPKRVAIFNDTSPGGHYGCFAVMCVLVKQLKLRNIEPVIFWPCARDWRKYKKKIKTMGFDGLVVNGEGSIHNTKTRERAQFLTELGPFCRDELNIPCFIVNASFYNLDDYAFTNLAAFNLISTRESKSQSYLSSHGLTSQLVPDFSFFSTKNVDLAQKRSGVFVTDSVFKNTREALSILADEFGFHFEVMKFAPETNSRFGKILVKISRELNNLTTHLPSRGPYHHQLAINPGFKGFVARLSASEAALTGRFHTCTLALATRTPVLALESNTPKISAVLNDVLGSTDRVRPIDDKNLPLYFQEVLDGYEYSPEELAAIDTYLLKGMAALGTMFNQISEALESSSNQNASRHKNGR